MILKRHDELKEISVDLQSPIYVWDGKIIVAKNIDGGGSIYLLHPDNRLEYVHSLYFQENEEISKDDFFFSLADHFAFLASTEQKVKIIETKNNGE